MQSYIQMLLSASWARRFDFFADEVLEESSVFSELENIAGSR